MAVGYAATEVKLISKYYVDHTTDIESGTIPVGKPVEGVEVFILNESGEKLKTGEVGEIAICSSYKSSGYWRDPILTAQKFHLLPGDDNNRIYLTGDIGKLKPNGVIVHLGRKDAQVKLKGHRIELGAIEAVLLEIDSVVDAVVSVKEDLSGQSKLVAYVVSSQSSDMNASKLQQVLSDKLTDYMLPAAYVFLKELSQTITGKSDHSALPNPDWRRPQLDNAYVAPRNAQEKYLVTLWEEVLGISGVGIYDNFFELGADSNKMTRLLNRLGNRVNPQECIKSLFDKGTVVELSQWLE